MTAKEILSELEQLGQASIKKVLLKHGIFEPLFGVKVEELKKIQKKVKKDYALSLELFDSGIYDAMYLAGLIADETKMTRKDLQHWVKNAKSQGISEYTVPWIAAESKYGMELALEWINADDERIASSGWSTICSVVAITDDKALDIAAIKGLLARIEQQISSVPNRVKQTMNMCVISIGIYVAELNSLAKETANRIGKVHVDVGDTDCKIPIAIDYITKAEGKGNIGKKKKMARC